MDFIEQFKQTFQAVLAGGDLSSARTLMQQFHKTNTPYDGDLYYFEALLAYYEGRFALARLWGRLCYEKYPEHPLITELLSYLTEGDAPFDAYDKNTFDCTFLNKKLRIAIYEGVLPIMDYTGEQFRKAFEALGHEVYVIDHQNFNESATDLITFAKSGLDFALCFNSIGTSMKTQDGTVLWDALKIPCINYLFDHPLYYTEYMDEMTEAIVVTCVDKNHAKWIKQYHPNITNSFYFPLGSEYISDDKQIPWEERPIDALYVGSLKENKLANGNDLTDAVMQYLLAHPDTTTEDAFALCIKDMPAYKDISDDTFKKLVHDNRFVDMNINAHYRKDLIVKLVQAGIHVTVYGDGWDIPELKDSDNFTYGGLIPQEECISKMQESKIVLNNLTWFKAGTHDRIFNGMLCGAVCVTDKSSYLTQEFTDGEDIVFYDLKEMDKLPQIVKDILEHPGKSAQIATKGFEKVALHHTWDERATELIRRIMQNDFL